MSCVHVYHSTPPGGPGLQTFSKGSVGHDLGMLAELGVVHLFQRRRPDGGLDYIYVPATALTKRHIERIVACAD